MKIKRSWLLIIVAGIGVFIILYSLARQFSGFSFGEQAEKYMFDILTFTALGIFLYNRKLAADEAREKKAEEQKPPV
ncbi:MAG: hypothetical protein LBC60_04130 [Spirochaetaceae bacterium]|jgi:hypothetical protein|nr:hypothetical protein [Spirochaetaceae bacterium]